MKKIELFFENLLWNSRLSVMTAVIASLLSSLAMFFVISVDTVSMISHLLNYAALEQTERLTLRSETITHVVELIDGYLLATVLLIFSFGLYELFISKIDAAESSDNSSKVLFISSLDDLKARLAKVVLMILIVKFFEHALTMVFATPLDLLLFAGGIALIGLALYLSHSGESKH
ncbi:MAG: YqhA family protein [Gammaproteobacteria bacterium]|nr:YqhA family protein [Gammaproteobacteria bacterium]